MNEIERKQLKGLGGWLILFQIELFSTLAGLVQTVLSVPLMRSLTNFMMKNDAMDTQVAETQMDMLDLLFSPLAFTLISVIFVLTLLCIIFFYRKKIIFRVFFIAQSVAYIVASALYYYFTFIALSAQTMGMFDFGGIFTGIMIAFSVLPALGITVAFIIALFKSHRVKNTFC